MNVQWQGVFLWKKIVMVIAKIDIWDRKCLIKYSLTIYLNISYDSVSEDAEGDWHTKRNERFELNEMHGDFWRVFFHNFDLR